MSGKPMTPKQWAKSTNPQTMLKCLGKRVSDRKLRLFACACCRRVWHIAKSQKLKQALPLVEGFADGIVKDRDRARANGLCDDLLQSSSVKAGQQCLGAELWQVSKRTLNRGDTSYFDVGDFAANAVAHAAGEYGPDWIATQKAERKEQVSLVN